MAATQPITYADAGAPPALLLHGLDDTTVLPRNTVNLAARLREAVSRSKRCYYPDMAHVGILLGLSSVMAGGRPGDACLLRRRPGVPGDAGPLPRPARRRSATGSARRGHRALGHHADQMGAIFGAGVDVAVQAVSPAS